MRSALFIGVVTCLLATLGGVGWALEGDDCMNSIIVPELPYNKLIDNTAEYSAYMDLGAGSCTGYPTAAPDIFFEVEIPGEGLCLELSVLMPCGGGADFCMYVLDACDPGNCVEGVDECGPDCTEYLYVTLEGGHTYYFVVDGKTAADTGCVIFSMSECQVGIEENAVADLGRPVLEIMPNPTKSGSQISYAIPGPSYVNLDIVSPSGQKVNSIYSGEMTEGIHSIIWNGSNEWGTRLPSGTYFVVLSMDDQRVMKRIQLLD
jgi:hypothetical protein